MSYDYVRRTYHVAPVIGARVRHNETGRFGAISREDRSQSHYVQVRFDGDRYAKPCHPTALDYHLDQFATAVIAEQETK